MESRREGKVPSAGHEAVLQSYAACVVGTKLLALYAAEHGGVRVASVLG